MAAASAVTIMGYIAGGLSAVQSISSLLSKKDGGAQQATAPTVLSPMAQPTPPTKASTTQQEQNFLAAQMLNPNRLSRSDTIMSDKTDKLGA